jgi:hypothetical protein
MFGARSLGGLLDAVSEAVYSVALTAALFLPLGLLAVFSLPRRYRWKNRVLFVALPALVLAVVASAVAISVDTRTLSSPDLLLGILGSVSGVWLGTTIRRGPVACLLFLPKVGLLLAVLFGLGAYVAYEAVEASPLTFAPTLLSSAEKRRVSAIFRGKDPRTIPAGETRTLHLTEHDVDLLLAWGMSLGGDSAKARVQLTPSHAELQASAPFARRGHLNLETGADVGVREGRLTLDVTDLRVGSVDFPRWLLRGLSPAVSRLIAGDRHVRPVLEAVTTASVESSSASVTYRRTDLPPGFVATLFHGEGRDDAVAVRAHVRHLLDAVPRLPAGDARFASALEMAFALARSRSATSSAVAENRAALLALGILMGHPRIESFVGEVLEEAERPLARRSYGKATLRGRNDWAKHAMVSAALTLLSTRAASDATGLFKEERDAGGGSGFSFGDLLADRAGTTFADRACLDERTAAALQARLAEGFRVDDFFPDGRDLPENLQDAELQSRYGGVGGTEYKRLVVEIERRIAACAGYR